LALPAAGVIEAITAPDAAAILVAPSNPVQGGDKTSHWSASDVLSVAE